MRGFLLGDKGYIRPELQDQLKSRNESGILPNHL
ncbi:MAG TPA: hypothetical protein VGJ00_07330 [Rhabdochlamydiaceae bacterium]